MPTAPAGWTRWAASWPASREGAVLTCSALKRDYRDRLRAAVPGLRFVFLALTREEAERRVAARAGAHMFPASLVANQFATLESPVGEPGVLELDATAPMDGTRRRRRAPGSPVGIRRRRRRAKPERVVTRGSPHRHRWPHSAAARR